VNALDLQQVAQFLGGAESVEPIQHGEWSKAFRFRRGNREYVVRFSATDDDFLKDQRVLRHASPALPMPRMVEIGEAFDGFYAVSERAHGDFLELRDEATMRRVLPSLLSALDAIRAVDVSDSNGFGLWSGQSGDAPHANWHAAVLAIPPAGARIPGWRERLSEVPQSARVFEAGYRQLEKLVQACPNDRHLVHSDLLYFNVLVSGDRVSAVLDWGSSLYGDFLWDLAWLTLWQPWYTAWAGIDIRGLAQNHYSKIGLDVPNFDERLRCYELAIGLDGLAYQAFAGHWDDLAWTTRRVDALLAGQTRPSHEGQPRE
jgi:hygromycin-B 4-O-kinase